MKLAYIYQEGTNINKANIYQSVSMVKALAGFAQVYWYRGFRALSISGLPKESIHQKRVFSFGLSRMEKISRLLFCFHTWLLLILNKPDVIFTRDFAFVYFYSRLPGWMRLSTPLIFEAHKVYHEVSDKVNYKQEMEAYRMVSKFIVVSEGIKEDLKAEFQIRDHDILVCPNGIEEYPLKAEMKSVSETVNLIYAGSYGPWKGVDTILEVSRRINNPAVSISVVGVDQENLPTYNREILSILPPISKEELYRFYRKMDIGIVPTLNHLEGTKYTSPIKLFEYAYAGLEILASDIPSIRELESRGFQIEFFKVGDAESLAEKIEEMASNFKGPNHKNREIASHFTWNHRASRIIEFIVA